MIRRLFIAFLASLLLASSAIVPAKPLGIAAGRVSGGETFPNITAPSGSASFTATWAAEESADGYLVYISTSAQAFPDQALYSYRYKATGQATASLAITGIASGTYYYRIAPYVGTTIGDVGVEFSASAS